MGTDLGTEVETEVGTEIRERVKVGGGGRCCIGLFTGFAIGTCELIRRMRGKGLTTTRQDVVVNGWGYTAYLIIRVRPILQIGLEEEWSKPTLVGGLQKILNGGLLPMSS